MELLKDIIPFSVGLSFVVGAVFIFLTTRKKIINLKGKVIVITGCDSGFGFSLAQHCASLGMLVVAGCFLMKEGANKLKNIPNVTVLKIDVTQEETIEDAVREVERITKEKKSVLHCVVNNAAAGVVFAEAAWQTKQQVVNQFLVNTVGPVLVTKSFLPLLSLGKGRVINVVSFCTECPLPSLAVYSSSKAALMSLTDGMRPEVAKYGVDVVMVNPGDHPSRTPLVQGQQQNYDDIQKEMKQEACALYGDYLSRCRSKFTTMFPPPPLAQLQDPAFYTTMTAALAQQNPATLYVNSDVGTKMFFGFIKKLPRRWADWMRVQIMRLPNYNTQ